MDDGGQRVFGRYGVESAYQLLAVGDVAGDDRGLGAEHGEFLAQGRRAGGVGPATAGEQQVPYAVARDEVTGDEGAEGAGSARDQDGAGCRIPAPRNGGSGRGAPSG